MHAVCDQENDWCPLLRAGYRAPHRLLSRPRPTPHPSLWYGRLLISALFDNLVYGAVLDSQFLSHEASTVVHSAAPRRVSPVMHEVAVRGLLC